MNRTQAISAGRAKTEIDLAERRFDVFQGAPGLTAMNGAWPAADHCFTGYWPPRPIH